MTTLVDTSVWVEHFRGSARAHRLVDLLEVNEVLLHPWVLGELALCTLGPRHDATLRDLELLPEAHRVEDSDVLELIRSRRLTGRGIGWVDAQILASALLADCELWTFDRRLATVAEDVGVKTKH